MVFHRLMGPWKTVERGIFWTPKNFGTQTKPMYPIIKVRGFFFSLNILVTSVFNTVYNFDLSFTKMAVTHSYICLCLKCHPYFSTLLSAYYVLVPILCAKDTMAHNLITNFMNSTFHHYVNKSRTIETP